MPSDVHDNPAEHRYQLAIGAGVAIVTYTIAGDVIALEHAEVPESARGQGVAGRLIAGVLADARSRGLSVTPHCPAVAAYMRRHADVQDLLTNEGRAIVARTD
jgi:uncharacterized protein